MLKKSLKIGSILLLIFAMVAFIGCDSGSGDTDPEETPVVPGPGPDDPDGPDVPTPPLETVTGVTITQATPEMLAGDSALFKAEVSGTDPDKTVEWTVEVADTDYYNVKEDGTIITDRKGAGLLVIDGGQVPGTVLTVTATSIADRAFYAETTVTVVKPGPRLSWTPNQIAVTTGDEGIIDEDAVSSGRLLDIYGKDIRILDGEYIEGQHFSIRRVDNLNNSLLGGTVTVTGSADEGLITVTLNGNVIGDKGPIGVTLYPSVLEGADASSIDLEGPGAELVYNVTSGYLIKDLSTVADLPTPLRGSTAPLTLTDGNATTPPRMNVSISWKGLTSGTYTHRAKAVATVTVTPLADTDYHFYTLGIDKSTIESRFKNGSPEVTLNPPAPKRLVFTLTYTITAKRILARDPTPNDPSDNSTFVLAEFDKFLEDLIVPGLVSHNQEAPVALRVKGESSYYSLTTPITWEGLSGKNFVGGKLATATVTIPAKDGYTFEGTTLTVNDLVGRETAGGVSVDKIFVIGGDVDHDGTPDINDPLVADITEVGDNLVFTLSYFVPRTYITLDDINTNVSVKLPLPMSGATPQTNLSVNKNGPFTGGSGAISWKGLSANNKFALNLDPTATVSMLAKEGYEFDPDIVFIPEGTSAGAATDKSGYITSVGTAAVKFNLSNKLVVEVKFVGAVLSTVTDYNLVISTANGLPANLIHGTPVADVTFDEGAGTEQIVDGSTTKLEWKDGIASGSPNTIKYSDNDHTLKGEIILVPAARYTFESYNSSTAKSALEKLFTIGTTKPEITLSLVKTGTKGVSNLKVVLEYPTERKTVERTGLLFNDDAFTAIYTADKIKHNESVPSVTAATSNVASTTQIQKIGSLGSDSKWNWVSTAATFNAGANSGLAAVSVVLKPLGDYTFNGFNTDLLSADGVANQDALKTLFTVKNGGSTIYTPSDPLFTVSGHNLTVTFSYPINLIKVETVLVASDFNDFTGTTFSGGKPTATNQFTSTTVASVIGIKDTACVTIEAAVGAAAWTGLVAGTPPTFPAASTVVSYKFTLVPKPGYTFDGATATTLQNIIEGLTNVPATGTGTGAVCTPASGGFDKMEVEIKWTL